MQRIHWWTLLTIAGTCLAATWVGQSVWGQPDEHVPGVNTVPVAPGSTSPQAPQAPPAPQAPRVPSGPLSPYNGTSLPPPPPAPSLKTSWEPAQAAERPGAALPGMKVSTPVPATPPTPATPPLATPPLATPPVPGAQLMEKMETSRSIMISQASPVPTLPTSNKEAVTPKASMPTSDSNPLAAPGLEARPSRLQPSVSLDWVGIPAARVHQPMPCQLLVRNTSAVPVQNVIVRQRLPQGIICKHSDPQAVTEVGELIWNLGNMAPEQTRHINVVLVSQMRGTANCQASVTFTGSVNHQVDIREPQLLVKMRAPNTAISGESVALLFAVNNPGDGMAEAVKVKALLPAGLEHARGKEVEVEIGNLAPKETRTMKLICLAKAGGLHKCTVVAHAEGDITSSDSTELEILMPKLDVVLNGPKLRYLDRHAIYVLKVANPGSAPATNVEVHKVLPAGFKFHQANHGGQYLEAERLVSWNLGDLQPGQSREIAVEVIPVEAGDHRVAVLVKASRGMKVETETHTRVEGLPSLLIELGDSDDPVEVGSDTSYELRVFNAGTKTETNVEVVCTLPDQLEFRSAKCSTTLRYRLEGHELIFEPLPRLAPKADVIYRIQVRGTAPGDIRFRTRIRSDGLRDPIIREEGTRIYSDDSPSRPGANVTSAPNQTSSAAPAAPNGQALTPRTAPERLPAANKNDGSRPATSPAVNLGNALDSELLDSAAFPLPGLPAANSNVMPVSATVPAAPNTASPNTASPNTASPIPVRIPLPANTPVVPTGTTGPTSTPVPTTVPSR